MAAAPLPPIYSLVGEAWAAIGVFLDLRALSCLRAASRMLGAALAGAPLDCWADLRCSAKGQRRISAAGLQALRRIAGPRLRALDLHGCTQLQSVTLLAAVLLPPGPAEDNEPAENLNNLVSLGLGDVRLLTPGSATPNPTQGMGTFLWDMLQQAPRLTRLDLSGCRSVDGYAINVLAECMDDDSLPLKWLALDGCASSLGRGSELMPLGRHAHKMYELGLGAFLHFNDTALLAALCGHADLARTDRFWNGGDLPASSLRVLRVNSSRDLTFRTWPTSVLAGLEVNQPFEHLHELVELDLSLCPRLSTAVFARLLCGSQKLRRVNLSGCDTLGDAELETMFIDTTQSQLIELNLAATGIGDQAAKVIGQRCRRLRSLVRIFTVFTVCSSFVHRFSLFFTVCFTNLHCFSLTQALAACDKLTPAALLSIVNGMRTDGVGGCKELRSLNLGHTGSMVTDDGIRLLLHGLPLLHRLCVVGSAGLTSNGVAESLNHREGGGGRRLLDLDLRHCSLTACWFLKNAAVEATDGRLVAFNGRALDVRGGQAAVGEALMAQEGGVHRATVGDLPVAATGCCSLRRTGNIAVAQPLYHCLTCAVVGQGALCSACATQCHKAKGHEVVFYCNAKATCDCAVATLGDGGCCCLW